MVHHGRDQQIEIKEKMGSCGVCLGCLRTRPCNQCASCEVGLSSNCLRMFCDQIIMTRQDTLQSLQEKIEKLTPDRPHLTFIGSLSHNSPEGQRHTGVARYFKFFKRFKTKLAKELFVMFNETMGFQLPSNLQIMWNKKFKTTGGACELITEKGGIRKALIELGDKVADRPQRVHDILAHEVAHAAAWVIDGVRGGHGVEWRKWADHLTQAYPEIPYIETTHDFKIYHRYGYQCLRCGKRTGRHQKPGKYNDAKCKSCYGKLTIVRMGSAHVGGRVNVNK